MGKIVEIVNGLEKIKGVQKFNIDGFGIEYPCEGLPKRGVYNNKTGKYINVNDLNLLYDKIKTLL